jgi:hypothetical protein
MEVILFYAMLIGGLGLAAWIYVTLLVLPVRLIGRRFGLPAGMGFAAVMATTLYLLFEPPYGGLDLGFAPAGMRSNLYLVGVIEEPPVKMIVASLVVSALGFALLLVDRLARRRSSRP